MLRGTREDCTSLWDVNTAWAIVRFGLIGYLWKLKMRESPKMMKILRYLRIKLGAVKRLAKKLRLRSDYMIQFFCFVSLSR